MIEIMALIGILSLIAMFFIKLYSLANALDMFYGVVGIASTTIASSFGWFFIYSATLMSFVQTETANITTATGTYTGVFTSNLYAVMSVMLNLASIILLLIFIFTIIEFIAWFAMTGKKTIEPRGREDYARSF